MDWQTIQVDATEAVADTLAAALPTLRVQCLDDLSDGVQDKPLAQVHFKGSHMDPSGNSGQTSFRGGVKQLDVDIQILVFVHSRSVYGEDIQDTTEWADRVLWVLMSQDTSKFGTTGSPSVRGDVSRTAVTIWDLATNGQAAGFTVDLTLRVY